MSTPPKKHIVIQLSKTKFPYEDLVFKLPRKKLPSVWHDLATVARWLKLNKLWSWYENPTYSRIKLLARTTSGRMKLPHLESKRPSLRGLFAWYKYLDHPLTVKDVLLILLAVLLLWALFIKDNHVIAEPVPPEPKTAAYKPLKAPKLAKQGKLAKVVIKPVYHAPVRPTVATGTVSGCGDNFYANYIYMHESGCRLDARNASSGACGIGQALPCSKLTSVCPTMSYVCQNSYFTSYVSRYGGWAGAYAFWLGHSWY